MLRKAAVFGRSPELVSGDDSFTEQVPCRSVHPSAAGVMLTVALQPNTAPGWHGDKTLAPLTRVIRQLHELIL